MWRNLVAPVNCCSRQLYTSYVTRWYSKSCMLTYQSAKHLSDFYRHPAHNFQSLLSTASYERAWFAQQCECCNDNFTSVAPHPAILKTSHSWSSSLCCNKTGHQHQLPSSHQLRHYMLPRSLTPSTKTILEASPLSLQPYLRLIRFDRPIGTWLLFLPCAWSISLAAPAGQLPDASMLALFALGSFSMRAAACTINDMWDKDYDARVARTSDRPLACGEISQFRALTFLALPLSVSLGVLLTFNWNTVALGTFSLVPCIIYPLMKRVTYWPQAFLGITLNWGVMIAWSAIHGSLTTPGFVLYTSCVLWTMIYDTIYSHQDKADDVQIGVKSTALKFGNQTKLWLAGFASGVTGGLAVAGAMCHQPWLYFTGVGVVSAHLAHQIYSVNLNDPASCATTFRSNRNLGLVFWALVVGAGLLAGTERKEQEDHVDHVVSST